MLVRRERRGRAPSVVVDQHLDGGAIDRFERIQAATACQAREDGGGVAHEAVLKDHRQPDRPVIHLVGAAEEAVRLPDLVGVPHLRTGQGQAGTVVILEVGTGTDGPLEAGDVLLALLDRDPGDVVVRREVAELLEGGLLARPGLVVEVASDRHLPGAGGGFGGRRDQRGAGTEPAGERVTECPDLAGQGGDHRRLATQRGTRHRHTVGGGLGRAVHCHRLRSSRLRLTGSPLVGTVR